MAIVAKKIYFVRVIKISSEGGGLTCTGGSGVECICNLIK